MFVSRCVESDSYVKLGMVSSSYAASLSHPDKLLCCRCSCAPSQIGYGRTANRRLVISSNLSVYLVHGEFPVSVMTLSFVL